MDLKLQPVQSSDEPFLFSVYVSTRAEEMALIRWDAAQQEAFLRMQFNAQRASYAMQFPNAEYSVITRGGEPIGRLIVDRSGGEILLIDIAFLPEFRGAGAGSELMQRLMAETSATQKPIRIHVEKFNRALRLYERLGFRIVGDSGLYLEMTWGPAQGVPAGEND